MGQIMVTFNPQMSMKHSEVATNGVGEPANEAAAAARPASVSSVSGNLDLQQGGAGSTFSALAGHHRHLSQRGSSSLLAAPPQLLEAEYNKTREGMIIGPTSTSAASKSLRPGSGCTASTCGTVLSPDGRPVKPQEFSAGHTFYVQLKGRDLFGNLMYQKSLLANRPPANIRATLCYVLQLVGMSPGA
jgi:hypothetical protein